MFPCMKTGDQIAAVTRKTAHRINQVVIANRRAGSGPRKSRKSRKVIKRAIRMYVLLRSLNDDGYAIHAIDPSGDNIVIPFN